MGEVDRGICTDCAGSGLVEIETFDLDIDDLEDRSPTIQIIPPGPWVDPHQPGAEPLPSGSTTILWNAAVNYENWRPDPTAGSTLLETMQMSRDEIMKACFNPDAPKPCPDCGGDPRTCDCVPW